VWCGELIGSLVVVVVALLGATQRYYLNGRGRRTDAHGGFAGLVDGDILSPVQDVIVVALARNP